MSRKPIPTRYDQLDRQQAQSQSADGTAVFPTLRASERRIESGKANGVSFLRAVFPGNGRGQSQVINLTFLLDLPHLAKPFSQAFLECYSTRSGKTRTASASSIRCGFFKHLKETKREYLAVGDLTTQQLNIYVKWLDRVDEESGTAHFTVQTRSVYLGTLRTIIEWLQADSPWSHQLPPPLSVPAYCCPAIARRRNPTRVLTVNDLRSIHEACVAEVIKIREFVNAAPDLIQAATNHVPIHPTTYRDYPDLATCLAALHQTFPDSIPTREILKAKCPFLDLAIALNHGGIVPTRAAFFPDPRALVPFVLLLAIHTRYNPETLFTTNLEDYSIQERIGQTILVARTYKARSKRKQLTSTPVDDAPDNPASIIAFLSRWTHRARMIAPSNIANRLFLFVPKAGQRSVKAYENRLWATNLNGFCKDNRLEHFTLRQIRPTILDVGISLYNGDARAAQALGNQRSVDTIFSHYMSDAQRQRNQEQLGEVMQERTRWRESAGLIDPRDRPYDSDIAAATPGWNCLDPYASPFSPLGKLCSAYGMCAICPLGQLDLTSPYACAQVHNLLDRARRSRATMTPQHWLAKIAPIEAKVRDFWLPQFPDAVHDRAAKEFAQLPPLAPLE